MRIVIVGAGKSGAYLAEKLMDKHEIVIVDQRVDRVATLRSRIPDLDVIKGDGCEPAVLERAGVPQADLVCAVTGDDEDNLVISLLSKRNWNVKTVVARVNHPRNEWLFTEDWGIDHAVSAAGVMYDLVNTVDD